MTRAEYLENEIDHCTKKAIECKEANDVDGMKFYLTAKIGFEKRLNKLSLEECEKKIK